MAKIDSESAVEAILEHRSALGDYEHRMFYIQEFVKKPGHDIHMLTTDDEPVVAMVRSSDHWFTNAAKGMSVDEFELDDHTKKFVRRASGAVGDGLLGIDLMKMGDGYTVCEVSHTVEFEALNGVVETDVPMAVIDWLEAKADGTQSLAEVSA